LKNILSIIVIIISLGAHAQTVQSDITLTDLQRLEQLKDSLGTDNKSYIIRSSSLYWKDAIKADTDKKGGPVFKLLQAGYTFQTNTNLPIGYNDGSMIPALGVQQRVTIGAMMRYKNLTIQLQPEFVSAANTDPVPFQSDLTDKNYYARYYLFEANKISNFSRIGKTPYQALFAGQSSIRYNTGNISFGISTENLWWGPGIRNSLVLTNNAPGFTHFTINSMQPIHSKWGNWEFQFVIGNLANPTTENPDNDTMRTIWSDGIAKKSNTGRAILGYIVSFNPKFAKNLFIGATGASYFFTSPVATFPTVLITDQENKAGPSRLGSLFVRYKMPKDNAEVWIEYGRSNRWAAPWNLIGDTIPTGYSAGIRKLVPVGRSKGAYMAIGFEITQLQMPDTRLIFNAANPFGIPKTNGWYTSAYNNQGYTNQAQVMGASIGPGSNSQTLFIQWIKGSKRIGFQFERVAHNNDFALYNYFNGIVGQGTTNKYWVDVNWGLNAQWNYKQFLFSAFYTYTKSLNYRWVKIDGGFAGPSTSDRNNSQFAASIHYFFD